MGKPLKEIEQELYDFVQKELDAKEELDITVHGNPNVRPKDKTIFIRVQQEKDRLIAAYKDLYGDKELRKRLERVIGPFVPWF